MWPIQLAFLLSTVRKIFLSSLTLCNTSSISHTLCPTDLLHPSPAAHFKISPVFLIDCPQCPLLSTTQGCVSSGALFHILWLFHASVFVYMTLTPQ
jgi:hypothetical protein